MVPLLFSLNLNNLLLALGWSGFRQESLLPLNHKCERTFFFFFFFFWRGGSEEGHGVEPTREEASISARNLLWSLLWRQWGRGRSLYVADEVVASLRYPLKENRMLAPHRLSPCPWPRTGLPCCVNLLLNLFVLYRRHLFG